MPRIAAALVVLAVLTMAAPAEAANMLTAFTLEDSASDGVCDTTSCTLRDAVGAAASGDTVFAVEGTHHLSSQVTIDKDLTVRGETARTTAVESASGRVFQVAGPGDERTVMLNDITIQGGEVTGAGATGGGIFIGPGFGSDVTLTRVVVTDNRVSDATGASTVGGGGIGVSGGNVLRVMSSTISGNTALKSGAGIARGGGIAIDAGPLKMLNTTVTGNAATGESGAQAFGGGIYVADGWLGGLALEFSTLASNGTTGEGGNIFIAPGGKQTVAGMIVADGSGLAGHTNCGGDGLDDDGANLESTNECGFNPANGSLVDTSPELGPLQPVSANGGQTPTRLPSLTSPAIDAGGPVTDDDPCGRASGLDQRYGARPSGSECDIGAVELQAPTATQKPAEAVGRDGATLVGAVDAFWGDVSYHFEYGPTAALGSSTPTASVTFRFGRRPRAGVTVMAAIDALEPATTYHHRLVVESVEGAGASEAGTFTTAANPAVATPGDPPVEQPGPPRGGPDLLPGGGPGPGTLPVAPRLTGLALKPASFRLGKSTRVAFDLAGSGGNVHFSVHKMVPGRRSGSRCTRTGRGRRCTRAVAMPGSIDRQGRIGANAFRFAGRLGPTAKPLTSGRYRLTASIGAAKRTAVFTVLPRRGR